MVSYADEPDHLRRFCGICGSEYAAWSIQPNAGSRHDPDDQRKASVYGISMLDTYKGTGWKKFYLIFGMCDESFSINYTAEVPEDVDKGWFMFFVTLLNHFYWFFGATLGGIFGSLIHFNTEGLEFVMTAMFVVIFMEQWFKDKSHASAILGLGLSALCLLVFGADNFIIPAMLAILLVLTLLRKPMEKGGGTV